MDGLLKLDGFAGRYGSVWKQWSSRAVSQWMSVSGYQSVDVSRPMPMGGELKDNKVLFSVCRKTQVEGN
jgi:hypothetical protein